MVNGIMRREFPRDGVVWPARFYAAVALLGWGAFVVWDARAALHGTWLAIPFFPPLLAFWILMGLSYATAYGTLAATESGIVVTCLGLDLRHIPWRSLTTIKCLPSGLGRAYRYKPGRHYRIFFHNTDRVRLTNRSIMTVDSTVRDGETLVQMAADYAGIAITYSLV